MIWILVYKKPFILKIKSATSLLKVTFFTFFMIRRQTLNLFLKPYRILQDETRIKKTKLHKAFIWTKYRPGSGSACIFKCWIGVRSVSNQYGSEAPLFVSLKKWFFTAYLHVVWTTSIALPEAGAVQRVRIGAELQSPDPRNNTCMCSGQPA